MTIMTIEPGTVAGGRGLEQIRREVAGLLALGPDEVPEATNLIEIGLHSLAIMRLIGPLSRLAGRRLDYAELATRPTLRDWQALIGGRAQV